MHDHRINWHSLIYELDKLKFDHHIVCILYHNNESICLMQMLSSNVIIDKNIFVSFWSESRILNWLSFEIFVENSFFFQILNLEPISINLFVQSIWLKVWSIDQDFLHWNFVWIVLKNLWLLDNTMIWMIENDLLLF